MSRGKQVFKSGHFLKAGTVLAHGSYAWLLKNLRDHEMGFCGESLYLKMKGKLVPLKESVTTVNTVDDYLYKVDFEWYEGAKSVIMHGGPAGCSSFRLGSSVGRNLDWYYSEQADFVITSHKEGCYRSIGIASHPLIDAGVAEGGTSPYFAELPWYTQDGVNEKGLYISHNVVPADISGGITDAIPSGKRKITLDSRQVTRYVLDTCASVKDAIARLSNAKIVCNKDLLSRGYGVHWMLADAAETVVLEIVGGKLKVIPADSLTNFWLHGVAFNADHTVYTNADASDGNKPTVKNNITPLGSGLERWNIIQAYKANGGINARELLNLLAYSRTYTETENPWYSEFAGVNGITVDTPPDDAAMQQALGVARSAYAERDRAVPQTWHTTHSCVYNLTEKSLTVVAQESGTAHSFGGVADA